jgi:two-component system capsular synthesis response regulator RcsB
MKDTIRVIVADDHSCVRRGVGCLLQAAPHLSLVGEAASAQALAELLDSRPCDVIVSDIGMPGMNGEGTAVSLLRRVLHGGRYPRVVVLTMIHHARTLMGLMHLGVTAIVDKRDVAGSLTEAIDCAFSGTIYLSGHACRALSALDRMSNVKVGVLSAQEWKVFQMYAHGMTIRQIAQKLDRSGKTISTQKRSAMRKLGLETEIELADYARQIGLT